MLKVWKHKLLVKQSACGGGEGKYYLIAAVDVC
jgi:hypothetical protein